jgi:hypothetical protein
LTLRPQPLVRRDRIHDGDDLTEFYISVSAIDRRFLFLLDGLFADGVAGIMLVLWWCWPGVLMMPRKQSLWQH